MSFIRHIHNYTEYNQEWNVFSAFNPSKCTHSWSSGQPMLRRPGNSWGFSAFLKGLTSVVDNSCRSRDSNPQPRVTSPTLYPLEPWLSPVCIYIYSGAKKYLVSHQLCKFSHLKRWERPVIFVIFHFQIIAFTVDFFTPSCLPIADSVFPAWCRSTILFLVSFDSSLVLAIVEFGVWLFEVVDRCLLYW